MKQFRGFASDNNSGVHPEIMKAIVSSNIGHTIGYGDDDYTIKAIQTIKGVFSGKCEVYFVFTGTAANVLGLKQLTHSYHSIICAETAHIEEDECGAPEFFTGCKLLPVSTLDGKLTPSLIKHHVTGFDFEHHSQPRVVSLTQATELGTVYQPHEIRTLADYVHGHGMYLHMDGARISNAAAYLGVSLQEITADCGVDVLSLGATKNGGMYGEAILFFNQTANDPFKYYRKQSMQLASKMRYMAVQFDRMFGTDLWLNIATHTNHMAQLLKEGISGIAGITITQPVESNGLFVQVPARIVEKLQQEFFFYVWDEEESIVRWMTSWDTTEEDIAQFVLLIKELMLASD